MVTTLDVGPYPLGVYDAAGGPVVVSDDPAAQPLTTLLNHARPGDDFSDAVRRRGTASSVALEVRPAGPDGDRAEVWALGADSTVSLPWQVLERALDAMAGLRTTWVPPPGRWLFTREPTSPLPSPEDLELMRRLGAEAEAIDAADLDAEVGAEPPDLVARRRRFLAECDAAGVFDRHRFVTAAQDARSSAIASFAASRSLLDLREAALRMRAWGVVPEGGSVLVAAVCLDFVRLSLWPPGDDGREWAERADALLSRPTGEDEAQGVVIEHVGGVWTRAYWRRDGPAPALLAVAVDVE